MGSPLEFYTPYYKMASISTFSCLYSNKPFLPRFPTQKSKEYFALNRATRAYLNVDKRILKWKPF